MAKPNKPKEQPRQRAADHQCEARRRELLRKIPEETEPAQEWGERLEKLKD